jgi:hypothetical protein
MALKCAANSRDTSNKHSGTYFLVRLDGIEPPFTG